MKSTSRIPILDLWRAISISLVLAGHLLPLGPAKWGMNSAAAGAGMAIFFTLSGFLITRFLIEDGNVRTFLLRRIARILPLAWLGVLMAFLIAGGTAAEFIGSMAFVGNLPPYFLLLPTGHHFWSLSLEVQFYVGVAMLVAIGGRRALILLPFIAIAVTVNRIALGQHMNIITWFRIDEILAGAILALFFEGWIWKRNRITLFSTLPLLLLPLLIASAHGYAGALNYARPYIAALMVGASIYNAPRWMLWLSEWRPVRYVADVSYGLYVFHGVFMGSWLGGGDTLVRYAKRPALFAATFACAHLSSRYYEKPLVRWVKKLEWRKREAALTT